jgi:hypothetical protein
MSSPKQANTITVDVIPEKEKIINCYISYIDTFIETGVHKSNIILKVCEIEQFLLFNFKSSQLSAVDENGLFKNQSIETTNDPKQFYDNLIEASFSFAPHKTFELVSKLVGHDETTPAHLLKKDVHPYKNGTIAILNGDISWYLRPDTTAIVLGDRVEILQPGTFARLRVLEYINIPDSVTSIGDYAFDNCLCLRCIIIPDSVTRIGESAFRGCENLHSVKFAGFVTQTNPSVLADCSTSQVTTRIDDGDSQRLLPVATSIDDGELQDCNIVTSTVSSVTMMSIGKCSFENCSSLESIIIPDSVTTIGEKAFGYCKSLGSVIIPNSVTSIGKLSFAGCSSLKSVTIGNSVTSIGQCAFGGCECIKYIIIPDSVTSIEHSAFLECLRLYLISMPYHCKKFRNLGNSNIVYREKIITPDMPEPPVKLVDYIKRLVSA